MITRSYVQNLVYSIIIGTTTGVTPPAYAQKADAGMPKPVLMDRQLYDQGKLEELLEHIDQRVKDRFGKRWGKWEGMTYHTSRKLTNEEYYHDKVDHARELYVRLKLALQNNDETALKEVTRWYEDWAREEWPSTDNVLTMIEKVAPERMDWFCSLTSAYFVTHRLMGDEHDTPKGLNERRADALKKDRPTSASMGIYMGKEGCRPERGHFRYFSADGLFGKSETPKTR